MPLAGPLASTIFSRFTRPFATALSPVSKTQARTMTGTQTATIAAGCFWGVEHLYRKNFGNGKGLLDSKVGYCGGVDDSPSYRAVCTGKTGRKYKCLCSCKCFCKAQGASLLIVSSACANRDIFLFCTDAEALQMTFDPSIVTFRQLIEFFYRMHDPTTENRQGPDVGTQYRSAIFTHGDEQQKIAEEITDKVSKEWYKVPLSTKVLPAGKWWDAEEYHQLYLQNNPMGYECPAQYVVLISRVKHFTDLFQLYSELPAFVGLTSFQNLIDISLVFIMHIQHIQLLNLRTLNSEL
jgi:peptide-methionine (S)-S-oxide reductase